MDLIYPIQMSRTVTNSHVYFVIELLCNDKSRIYSFVCTDRILFQLDWPVLDYDQITCIYFATRTILEHNSSR